MYSFALGSTGPQGNAIDFIVAIVSPAVAQSNALIPTPSMHLVLLVLSVIYIFLTPVIATSLRVKKKWGEDAS